MEIKLSSGIVSGLILFSLNHLFPRLFMVSMDIDAFIDEIGEWKNDSWCYNLR